MTHIALVAPSNTACTGNAGAHMITAGIRYLVRAAVPDALFITVDMLRDDARQWAAARESEALVLCGNPRFSLSDDAWWEDGIWGRINACVDAGVRVLDGWAGASVGLGLARGGLPTQADHLLRIARNHRVLQHSYRLAGVIARDALAHHLYTTHGIRNAHHLPCSSWYAAREYGVMPDSEFPDIHAAIVLLALRGHAWAPDALRRLAGSLADRHGQPCAFIATTFGDFEWANEVGLQRVMLVTDPPSLLRLYARCVRVVSLRIHASIPAASMGAQVCTLAVDSRAQICEPFGLPVQPFTDLQRPDFVPQFAHARAPDIHTIVSTMRTLLTC